MCMRCLLLGTSRRLLLLLLTNECDKDVMKILELEQKVLQLGHDRKGATETSEVESCCRQNVSQQQSDILSQHKNMCP